MESRAIKVHIDLPHHWASDGESLWATPLGFDRYRIENVPFFAYDLNYHDIVEAVSSSPELKPSVLRVLERSGHRTIRVFFTAESGGRSAELLDKLKKYGAEYERSSTRHVALDLAPQADTAKVRSILDEWFAAGVAEYETCEARIAGSFGGDPTEVEGA